MDTADLDIAIKHSNVDMFSPFIGFGGIILSKMSAPAFGPLQCGDGDGLSRYCSTSAFEQAAERPRIVEFLMFQLGQEAVNLFDPIQQGFLTANDTDIIPKGFFHPF